MMVVNCRWLCAVILLASFGLAAAPAAAQSVWQQLFGAFGSSAKTEPASKRARSRNSFEQTNPYGDRSYREQDDEPAYGGNFRTVCVRTCDGFYWPVSGSASRIRFNRDAKVCESSCVGEAKLYYMPKSSDDVKDMSDLSGRAYGSLENAFLYRKTLVKGCGCKPAPWSQAEAMRHSQYAAEAAARRTEIVASEIALDRKVPQERVSLARPEQIAHEKTFISLAAIAGPDAGLAADAALLESTLMPSGDRLAYAQSETPNVSTAQFVSQPKAQRPWRQAGTKAKHVKTANATSPFAAWLLGEPSSFPWLGDGPRRSR